MFMVLPAVLPLTVTWGVSVTKPLAVSFVKPSHSTESGPLLLPAVLGAVDGCAGLSVVGSGDGLVSCSDGGTVVGWIGTGLAPAPPSPPGSTGPEVPVLALAFAASAVLSPLQLANAGDISASDNPADKKTPARRRVFLLLTRTVPGSIGSGSISCSLIYSVKHWTPRQECELHHPVRDTLIT